MYSLDNRLLRGRFGVTVVGCGGTGSFVAESLCRLLPERGSLLLIDPDVVTEQNLVRQNFTSGDVGRSKSEALALRLSSQFERPVAYSMFPVALSNVWERGIIIGCVDNGPARADIARFTAKVPSSWWIDAGNGEDYGQVLIGNHVDLRPAFVDVVRSCVALPPPSVQRPEILAQEPPRRSCAEAAAAGEQGPTINQAMAVLAVEAVRRLIDGTCTWMQLYLDLKAGTLVPVQATPEAVSRVTGIQTRYLVTKLAERR